MDIKTKQPWAGLGLMMAVSVVMVWALSLTYALTQMPAGRFGLSHALMMLWLQYLYCGLFITAHDACHGSVLPGHPAINLWVGRLCAGLYAGFSFDHLNRQHHLHHAHSTGVKDPDSHGVRAPSFVLWAYTFFSHYVTVRQLLWQTFVSQVLLRGLHLPPANVYLFWAVPALASAIQLFTFGTYLPHRHQSQAPFADAHHARNSGYSYLLSLLSCYHFGYHHIHHLKPHLPWFGLPGGLADQRAQEHKKGGKHL